MTITALAEIPAPKMTRPGNHTTHGKSRTHEYRAWCSMKTRCYNPNRDHFAEYGGRGITVCDRWRESFEAFLADMGPAPTPQHTIERKDNNGHYEPDNCVWATMTTQRKNRRDVRRFEYRGEMLMLSEISERCGVELDRLQNRVNVLGWTVERATSQPKRKHPKWHYVFDVSGGAPVRTRVFDLEG